MSKTVSYAGEQYAVVDVGSRCVYCNEDTAFGSGRFVNRVGADHFDEETKEYRDGYSCADCMSMECDRCGEGITLDEDITPYCVYGDDEPDEFSDGAYCVHQDCLTAEETKLLKENPEAANAG